MGVSFWYTRQFSSAPALTHGDATTQLTDKHITDQAEHAETEKQEIVDFETRLEVTRKRSDEKRKKRNVEMKLLLSNYKALSLISVLRLL